MEQLFDEIQTRLKRIRLPFQGFTSGDGELLFLQNPGDERIEEVASHVRAVAVHLGYHEINAGSAPGLLEFMRTKEPGSKRVQFMRSTVKLGTSLRKILASEGLQM